MTSITITNKSAGPKTFNNVNKQQVSVKPGETKTIDVDPHHAILLSKEAQRKGSGIELKIHDEEQFHSEAQAIAEAKAGGPQPHKMGEVYVTRRIPPGGPDDDVGGPQEPERSADPQPEVQPVTLEERYPIEESGAKAAAPEEQHEEQGEEVQETHHRRPRAKSHRRPARE